MLSKWCETTSMNGATDWYESRNSKPLFVFWTIIMLAMISCCVFFTYKTVEDYIQQPTQTTMQTVQVGNMDIPEVLVCFNGGLNVEAMRQSGFSMDFITKLHGGMKFSTKNTTVLDNLDEEIKLYTKKRNINVKRFMQNFTYSCQDIFPNPSDKMRCEQNISSLFSTYYGQCVVFRNNSKQNYPGIEGGIEFYLHTPKNSFYEFNPKLATKYSFSNSFSVSLDSQFGWITRRSLLIPANVRSEITLHPIRYIRSACSKPCDDGTNIYSSNTCFHRCYARAVYDYCGCYLLEYLNSESEYNYTNICSPTESKCSTYDEILAQPCQQKCRPKCDEWVYSSTVTYALLEPNPINESESIVLIGYDSMGYMQVEEVDSFTIFTGLANVGGQAGLWLGISIVTIIQGAYYLLLSVWKNLHMTVAKK